MSGCYLLYSFLLVINEITDSISILFKYNGMCGIKKKEAPFCNPFLRRGVFFFYSISRLDHGSEPLSMRS